MTEPPGHYPQIRPDGERVAIEERLDHCRGEVRRIAIAVRPDLARQQLIDTTDLTVAGLVRHLAWVEDHWFQARFLGERMPAPWNDRTDERERSMYVRGSDSLTSVLELYAKACERSRDAAARFARLDAGAAVASFGRGPVNLRWILVHLIEETARHLGHLDLLADRAHGREPSDAP